MKKPDFLPLDLHIKKTVDEANTASVDERDRRIAELEIELKGLREFKEYFDDLYGTGLEIAGWHLNGELESFDSFYEEACGGME